MKREIKKKEKRKKRFSDVLKPWGQHAEIQ